MKPWRQICFVVLALLWLANLNIVVPMAVHTVLAAVTLGLALALLFTVDWGVFKRPIGQVWLQEMIVLVWVVVVGLNFLGLVGQMMHAAA